MTAIVPTRVFATPRGLPRPRALGQRVVVLDIAFASGAGGCSFETTTWPFIEALGERLAVWVDHHDSQHHTRFAGDPRFVLHSKAEHPACPELVTAELVARVEQAGAVDTLVCHGDFDGLASAAKWLRGGVECYPGCDSDARAIDTRSGLPGDIARRIDRAIRAAPRDRALLDRIVLHLAGGAQDAATWELIDAAGARCAQLEAEAARLAVGYRALSDRVALVDVSGHAEAYDKTELLLLGQQRAVIAVVVADDNVSFAAAFDSGVNFLEAFNLSGGMPTVVSIQRARLDEALRALGVKWLP